jgi:chemotaxis regulatin CheY-phosphate phosphatase CheZ
VDVKSTGTDLLDAEDRLEEVVLMGRDAPEGAYEEAVRQVREARARLEAELRTLRREDG